MDSAEAETDKKTLVFGSEDRFLPFECSVLGSGSTFSINSTGMILAIANEQNIDIYNLDTGDRTVLSLHAWKIRTLGFSPTDPNLLVSWSSCITGPRIANDSDSDGIIVWDLDRQQPTQQNQDSVPIAITEAAKAGVEAVIARLGDTLELPDDATKEMESLLRSSIERYDPENRLPYSARINGRIGISSDSPLFSHSGEYLIFAPPESPTGFISNTFDICLYSFANRTTKALVGQKDSIVWAGFSPDDSLVASGGWKGDFRVHDLTGKEVCSWKQSGQIQAAMFSPDGKYLLITNRAGMIRVWDVNTGTEISEYDYGPRGCRILDWSSEGDDSVDEQYILVGSDSQGRLGLFKFAEGKLEFVQERKLSMEKSDIESLDPSVRPQVGGFFSVQTARFARSIGESKNSMKVVYSVSTDEGIEVFDFRTGKGWRFEPPHQEEGSTKTMKSDKKQNRVIGHFWRKETGELGIIAPDGIRFWRLK